jgi:hypothetical protein
MSPKIPHEHIHIKFCKRILGVHKNAMNIPVLAELGRFPLSINIIGQVIMYWMHIINLKESNHVKRIYNLHRSNPLYADSWISFLKSLLVKLGLTHIWQNQNTFNKYKLKYVIIQKLQHEFIQFWRNKRNNGCSKLKFYNAIVKDYKLEPYLESTKNTKHRLALAKLRISAHDLEIEKGRYKNIISTERLCKTCKTIEDEFHFLDECIIYNELRKTLLSDLKLQSNSKVSEIILSNNKKCLHLLCTYVHNCFILHQSVPCNQ